MVVEQDVYFKKEVELEFEGNSLRFRVAQDLFSSFDVDVGTRQLLRSLAQVDRADFGKVLDLGCGYGPNRYRPQAGRHGRPDRHGRPGCSGC